MERQRTNPFKLLFRNFLLELLELKLKYGIMAIIYLHSPESFTVPARLIPSTETFFQTSIITKLSG